MYVGTRSSKFIVSSQHEPTLYNISSTLGQLWSTWPQLGPNLDPLGSNLVPTCVQWRNLGLTWRTVAQAEPNTDQSGEHGRVASFKSMGHSSKSVCFQPFALGLLMPPRIPASMLQYAPHFEASQTRTFSPFLTACSLSYRGAGGALAKRL
jgi:hypothetical protein